MTIIILLFAGLLVVAGLFLLLKPDIVLDLLKKYQHSFALHVAAVVVRLVFGLLLLALAAESRFPGTVKFLGWIAIVAAIVLAVIGRQRFNRLMQWALSIAKPYYRLAAALSIALGGFLLYAFLNPGVA